MAVLDSTVLTPNIEICGATNDKHLYLEVIRQRMPRPELSLDNTTREQFIQRYFGAPQPERDLRGLEGIISRYCQPDQPRCSECPLRYNCEYPRNLPRALDGDVSLADFFCGAGGLSLGFEQAGFIPQFALDNDYWSIFTYLYNRPAISHGNRVLCEDINTWLRHDPKPATVDVVAGGVPCQSFSNANQQRQENDPRDNLFTYLFQAIDRLKPQAVLIENVSGFRKVGDMVKASFNEHNFASRHIVIDASDFGLPQKRKRLFFIGFSQEHFEDSDSRAQGVIDNLLQYHRREHSLPLLNEAQEQPITLRDAIADLPALDPVTVSNRPDYESVETGVSLRYHDLSIASPYVRTINGWRDSVMTFNHKARYNNERDIKIFSLLKQGEDSLSESIAEIMPYRSRNHIFKDKYFKLRYDEPCRTITAHMRYDCNTYIHPTQPRGLTAREAARVQGFPDDYVFTGTFQRLYQQVGNAVPPPLASLLAKAIRPFLRRHASELSS